MNVLRFNPQIENYIANIDLNNIEKVHLIDIENLVGVKPTKSESYRNKVLEEYSLYCTKFVNFKKDTVFVACNAFIFNDLRNWTDSNFYNFYLIPINGKNGADKVLVDIINMLLNEQKINSTHQVHLASGDGIFLNCLKRLKEKDITIKTIGLFNRINRKIYFVTDKITYRNYNLINQLQLDNASVFTMDYICKCLDLRYSLEEICTEHLFEIKSLQNPNNSKRKLYLIQFNKETNNLVAQKKSLEKITNLVKKYYELNVSMTIRSVNEEVRL